MLNYQPIRARYELAIRDALLPLGVPLHYDNVQEEVIPPGGSVTTYATITISFPSSTEADLCGGVVHIRGNVQVNMYAPRMGGMLRLEQMASAVICALMDIGSYPEPDGVITSVQSISGPTPLLSGQDPQAIAVVAAPFTARVIEVDAGDDGDGGTPPVSVTTADVDLTNPTRAAFENIETTIISPPGAGVTTQEDANQYFARVIDELDEAAESIGDYTNISDLDELI
jgi:hypothetical protein